jgi:Flp pilus assembly protein TadG
MAPGWRAGPGRWRPGRCRTLARRARRAASSERGSSAIELAILAPVLLFVVWLTIQFALYTQGRQVALAAAQIGARVARQDAASVPGWQAIAEHSAQSYYQGLGTRVLGGTVTATATAAGPSRVQVTVTGKVASILLGLPLPISERAGGPVECFRPDLNGGQLC